MKTSMKLLSAIGALALSTAPAKAQLLNGTDYCLTFSPSPYTLFVGQGYTIPPKGQSRPWNGFAVVGGFMVPVSGNGTTSSDGTTWKLTSFDNMDGTMFFDGVTLNLPAQTGENFPQGIQLGRSFQSYPESATGTICAPGSHPVPR